MQLAPLLLKSFYDTDPSIVTDFREELDKVRADAHTLLFDCLRPETEDICRRYWEIWQRTPMRLPSIRTELLPARTHAYNRAYKTHNARIRYGTMTREEFKAWTEEAKKRRDACQAGESSLERFEEWLKD